MILGCFNVVADGGYYLFIISTILIVGWKFWWHPWRDIREEICTPIGLWVCVRFHFRNLHTQSILYLGLFCLFAGLVCLFDDLPIWNYVLLFQTFAIPKFWNFNWAESTWSWGTISELSWIYNSWRHTYCDVAQHTCVNFTHRLLDGTYVLMVDRLFFVGVPFWWVS